MDWREASPALSLPNEISRIKSSEFEPVEIEIRNLLPGKKPNGATVGYLLRDTFLADGSVYYPGGHYTLRPRTKSLLFGTHEIIDEAVLCSHWAIERFFGHWVKDALVLELLASSLGKNPIVPDRDDYLHEPGYRALTKLPKYSTARAQVKKLWIINDRGLNENRVARFKTLRARVRDRSGHDGPQRVMLARGTVPNRHLVNENEIAATLLNQNFLIVHPEQETPERLCYLLGNARTVVLVEGSAQAHPLLCGPPGATIITLQSAQRFCALAKGFTDAIGMQFGYVIGEERGQNFYLDPDRLTKTLALI